MVCVRAFSHLGKADVAVAGGKGASLGEMTRAGIPVPPGFVVTAQAFDHFIDERNIRLQIDAILHSVNHHEMLTVERASEHIHELILNQSMPQDLEKDILAMFDELNAQFVAVRSSATAEDGATAAWAGQLDTYLNTTRDHVLRNVQRCWASLFTPRAIFYRFEKGMHGTHISVAVVVQSMVHSDIAGIAFSVHPVTQAREHLIIEAALGLGEAVVSGQVTPDSYVVEKGTWEVMDTYVSEQERGLYRGGEGCVWQELGEKGFGRKLTEQQVLELAKMVVKIENHYSFPVDIEWAIAHNTLYILQARPITTLTPKSGEKGEEL